MSKHTRVLLAKMGLDCHDTGIVTVAYLLRDAGFEVIYLGLHNSAPRVVEAAIEEGVDAIGVSFLSGQHMTQMKTLMAEMAAHGLDVPVFCGGVIPDGDVAALKALGVAEVFTPGVLGDELVARLRVAIESGEKDKETEAGPRLRPDLSETPLERCQRAIQAGDKETALREAQAIWDEWRPLHDLYVDMTGLLVTFIRDELGEEAVEKAWRYVGEQVWKPLLMQMKESGSTKPLIEAYAQFLRAHGHRFTVEEDEEKTSFIMHYCASGGMLMRDGKNEDSDRHPLNIAVMKTRADWTFNRALSAYCVHTPLWMDIMPREWGWDVFESTFGRQFDDDGKPVDEPCVARIYHQPRS